MKQSSWALLTYKMNALSIVLMRLLDNHPQISMFPLANYRL